jgi:YD repeat-containing protein
VLTNTYDTLGRVTAQKDPAGRQTTYSYVAGTTTITDPKGSVTQEHFSNLELVAITRGLNTAQEATWKYTNEPVTLALTSVTDPNGHTSQNTFDGQAYLLSHTDALGRKTSYTYDALFDLKSTADPLGTAMTYTYDTAGNLLTVSRPLAGTGQTWQLKLGYG